MRLPYGIILALLLPNLLHAEPGEKTVESYQKSFDAAVDPQDKEEALYQMIELMMEKGQYELVEDKCRLFVGNVGFGRLLGQKEVEGIGMARARKARVLYLLGKSYQERDMIDSAIGSFARTWSTYMGFIEHSAPAMEAWLKLLWERNQPARDSVMSDRQGAMEGGRRYLKLTGRFEDKMREVDRRLWTRVKDLVEKYEAELEKH